MRPIRKIDDLPRRVAEHGRIRFGIKGAKGQPQALKTFRFTSPDAEAIQALAEIYGGTARPWADPKHPGEWEVVTEANQVRVILPPDPLGDTPIYEMWAGGGILRRCDGEVCLVPTKTAEGAEMTERSCVCDANQKMECKPKTRLNVVLPDLRFGGVWRLETGGWNAAQELPGMVETIQSLQDRGFVIALLGLRQESSTFAGQTRKFVTPYLMLDATPQQLVSGEATLRGIAPAPPVLAINAPEPEPEPEPEPATVPADDFDEDVAEAEIVDDARPFEPMDEVEHRKQLNRMFALLAECGIDKEERAAFALRVSEGRTASTGELAVNELETINRVLTQISRSELAYQGRNEQGYALVSLP